MSEPSSIPARGYSWAPFQPGHTLSTKHGAQSQRHLRPLVNQLLEEVRRLAPWCSSPVFAPTVEAWAWAEAQAVTYRNHFDEAGLGLDDEEPPKGDQRWDRAEGRAAKLRAELGLSPVALTRLLGNLSTLAPAAAHEGLAELQQVGAKIRAAIEAAPTSDPPAGDRAGDHLGEDVPAELEDGQGNGDDEGVHASMRRGSPGGDQ